MFVNLASMAIVFFIMKTLELTYMFLLKKPLKQLGICFSEIGLDSQKKTANFMLMPNLRQSKVAALIFKNIMKIKVKWYTISIREFLNI